MSYWIEVKHEGLNKYQMIRGPDRHVVEARAAARRAQWDEEWARKQNADQKRQLRDWSISTKERRKAEANERTSQAQATIHEMGQILKSGAPYRGFDWNSLKDFSQFVEAEPQSPQPVEPPIEPIEGSSKYKPAIGLLEKIFASRKRAALAKARALFEADHKTWSNNL